MNCIDTVIRCLNTINLCTFILVLLISDYTERLMERLLIFSGMLMFILSILRVCTKHNITNSIAVVHVSKNSFNKKSYES